MPPREVAVPQIAVPSSPRGSCVGVAVALGAVILRTARSLGLVLIVVAAVACGGDERPSVAEWTPRWEAVLAEAPGADAEVDRTVCDRLLVAAREAEPDLLPTPDEALDGPVQAWLDEAEAIGFECESYGDLEHGRAELEILEAEVEAGLAILR